MREMGPRERIGCGGGGAAGGGGAYALSVGGPRRSPVVYMIGVSRLGIDSG